MNIIYFIVLFYYRVLSIVAQDSTFPILYHNAQKEIDSQFLVCGLNNKNILVTLPLNNSEKLLNFIDTSSNILKEIEFANSVKEVAQLDSSRIIIRFNDNMIIYNFVTYAIEKQINFDTNGDDLNIVVLSKDLILYNCYQISVIPLENSNSTEYFYETDCSAIRTIIKLKGYGIDTALLIYSPAKGLYIFDYEKNDILEEFSTDNSSQKLMAQLNSSSLIAMSQNIYSLVLYNIETREVVTVLGKFPHYLNKIMQIEGTNKIVAAQRWGSVKVFNTDTGQLVTTIFEWKAIQNFELINNNYIGLTFSNAIRILSLQQDSQASQIIGTHDSEIYSIKQIEGTNYFATVGKDQLVKVWDLYHNTIVGKLNCSEAIYDIAQYQKSDLLLITLSQGSIIIWNYQQQNEYEQYNPPFNLYTFSSLVLSDSDFMLIGNSDNIIQFNIQMREYDQDVSIPIINALSMAEVKNEIVVSNFDNIIYRIDKSTKQIISQWTEDILGTTKIVYSEIQDILIITGYYESIYVYNVSNNYSKLHQLDYHEQPAFGLQVSVSGSQLISGGWDNKIIIWDFLTGEMLKLFLNFPGYRLLSLDNDIIISAHQDGTIEKFSKSLQCDIDSSSFSYINCGCNAFAYENLYLNDTDSSFLTCITQTNVTFNLQEEQLPNIFIITYTEYWSELITSLVNSPEEFSTLEIDGLQYLKDFSYEFYTFNENGIVLKIQFITSDLIIDSGIKFVLTIKSEKLEASSYYYLTNKILEYSFSEEITLCNPGFYKNSLGECVQSTVLYPSLSVTERANVLKLTFTNSEELEIFKSLSSYLYVHEIVGYSSKKYTYHIQQDSQTEFSIIFSFYISILDGVTLPKTIIKVGLPQNIIYSNKYTLNKQYLSAQLMKNNLESADNLAESLGDAQSAAANALVYGSILCSLSGNAQALSSFFILGLIQLLKFQKIEYSSEIWTFFKAKQGFVQKILSFVKISELNPEEIDSIPTNLQKYNFSCYFWNNHYKDIILISSVTCLAVSINFANKLIQKSKLKERKKFMTIWDKIYQAFVWNLVYLVILQAFLNGVLYSFTQIIYGKLITPTGIINYVLAITYLALNILLIGHIFIMIKQMKIIKRNIQEEDKIKELNLQPNEGTSLTMASLKPFINEFNQSKLKKGIIAVWLAKIYSNHSMTLEQKKEFVQRHLIICGDYKENVHLKYNLLQYELLRLALLGFVIITLLDYPLLQTLLNILALIVYLVVFTQNQIGKLSVMKILQIVVEVFISCSYAGAFLYSQYDLNGEGYNANVMKNIQLFIIIGIFGITYIQLGSILFSIGKSIKAAVMKAKAKIQQRKSSKVISLPEKK